jgi:Ca-activated chloride channel homolog
MLSIFKITPGNLLCNLLICIFLLLPAILNAQSDKKFIRKGNREYEKNRFTESELLYRRAMDRNERSPDAIFNIGNALYKQDKFEDAGKQFVENINVNDDNNKKSSAFYNLGNSLLKANQFEESIGAYKEALKLRPDNIEAKYNLAYAQDMLKEQQQQQQQQQQDQDNQQDKENQDKNQNQEGQQDQDDEQDSGNQQQDQENQDQQEEEQGISKEDAERLLNAIANDEKKVQEKVKLDKAAKSKVRTIKNW